MEPSSLFYDADHDSPEQPEPARRTWNGQAVTELTGSLEKLYPKIPLFSRQPFQSRDASNQYLDIIVREPLTLAEDPVPVATVSKSYRLVQHRDILSALHRALGLEGISVTRVQSHFLMSEYGERMQWSCDLPGFDFDPGDGHPVVLRVNCLNSVDTSTAMEIRLIWHRPVCRNRMLYRLRESKLRRRHISAVNPEDIARYLGEELERMSEEQGLYKEWHRTPAEISRAEAWADKDVTQAWGPHAAARLCSMLRTGCDGEVEAFNPRQPPHTLALKNTHPVPGLPAPVGNFFHVSQALSWLAGTRSAVQEELEYVQEIHPLMEVLEKRGA